MIAIKMPGGDVEFVQPSNLLWMRNAFDWEVMGTVMLRIGGERYFSSETISVLIPKFAAAGVKLVTFTAPEGSVWPTVNASAVIDVEAANPIFHHPEANAFLKFNQKLGLAVRETVDEVNAKLAHETIVA